MYLAQKAVHCVRQVESVWLVAKGCVHACIPHISASALRDQSARLRRRYRMGGLKLRACSALALPATGAENAVNVEAVNIADDEFSTMAASWQTWQTLQFAQAWPASHPAVAGAPDVRASH